MSPRFVSGSGAAGSTLFGADSDLILLSLQRKPRNKPAMVPRAPQSAPQPPQFMRDAYPSPPAAFRAPGRISALPSPRTRPAAAGGSHHSRPPHMPDSTQHSQSPRITLGTAPAARAGGLGPGGWAAASRACLMVKSLSINHSFCPTAPLLNWPRRSETRALYIVLWPRGSRRPSRRLYARVRIPP